LKPISLFLWIAASALAIAAVVPSAPAAQTAQDAAAASAPVNTYPAPANLKVLPKDLTGAQVRQIMSGWADQLGGDCSTCHVRNPNDIGPNGRPRYNFADDSKEEKKTARVMYTMVQSINANFISTVPNSGMPVVCGTCHRGHLSPPPFSDSDDAKPAAPAK
jgi:hypothetical protein